MAPGMLSWFTEAIDFRRERLGDSKDQVSVFRERDVGRGSEGWV